MKAVMLAGDFGTRLVAGTEFRPNPMAEISGRSIMAEFSAGDVGHADAWPFGPHLAVNATQPRERGGWEPRLCLGEALGWVAAWHKHGADPALAMATDLQHHSEQR